MTERDQDTITLPKLKVEPRSSQRDSQKPGTHADEVRARRSTRLQPAVTKPTKRVVNQKPLPAARYVVPSRPVVVRGTASSLPLQKKTANKTRRQYHIALNTPGAEIRLPSVAFIRPGWRILSGLIVMAMIGALYALVSLPEFQFSQAKVTGAQRVTTADIDDVLKIEGLPAFAVKPQTLVVNLQKAFPEFSKVSVKVGLPATLSVAVVEREPAIAWQQGDTTLWIDNQGYSFPVRGDAGKTLVTVQSSGNPPGAAVEAPQQDGSTQADQTSSAAASSATGLTVIQSGDNAPKPYISADLVSAVLALSTQAPQGTTLLYDPTHGLGWVDPNGWQVYFGSNLQDMDLKISEYNAIVQELTQQGITPVMISVEFPHAPFYRTEK